MVERIFNKDFEDSFKELCKEYDNATERWNETYSNLKHIEKEIHLIKSKMKELKNRYIPKDYVGKCVRIVKSDAEIIMRVNDVKYHEDSDSMDSEDLTIMFSGSGYADSKDGCIISDSINVVKYNDDSMFHIEELTETQYHNMLGELVKKF